MNKLIDNLFEKDLVIKIISILTAILIWFLVLDNDNPFEERMLSIPLTSNIEVLQANNLQIVGSQLPSGIDIRIKGRRQKIMGVTANDFRAFIDLSEITEPGIQRINIEQPEYLGEQDIIISFVNPRAVTLNIERIVGKQYPVNVQYTGKLPDGYELVNVKIEPSNVILEEKESSISRVGQVIALINLDEIKDNKEIVMRGTVLDTNGQPLKQFDGKVPVIVTFDLAKRVPVFAGTKGNPAADYYLKEIRYSLPEVRIIGTKSVLDGVKSINAESIDINNKSESFKLQPVLILPNGTTIYGPDLEQLTAEVVLDRYITRNINIPTSMISIYKGDTADLLDYRIMDELLAITVKGRSEAVSAIKIGDIKLSVQAEDLEPGEHEVPVSVQVPGNVSLVGEYSVNIRISEIPPPDEPVHGTPDQEN